MSEFSLDIEPEAYIDYDYDYDFDYRYDADDAYLGFVPESEWSDFDIKAQQRIDAERQAWEYRRTYPYEPGLTDDAEEFDERHVHIEYWSYGGRYYEGREPESVKPPLPPDADELEMLNEPDIRVQHMLQEEALFLGREPDSPRYRNQKGLVSA